MNPDLMAQLHPPRLPAGFTQFGAADLLAGFGAGLLLAALALWLAAPFLRARAQPPSPRQRIEAARALPPQPRQLALLRLLAERGGTLPDDLRAAIYAGDPPDPARIEALILAAPARRKRA